MLTRKREAMLADKLDRLLAGETIELPAGLLEEKIWQTLRTLELNEHKTREESRSVQKLIGDISHQLKTPLSSLSLYLDLIDDNSLTDKERASFLDECRTQVAKINWLTESLLKITRLETGLIEVRPVSANLSETLTEALTSVKPAAAAKGLHLEAELPEVYELPHDPLWTKEAFINILDNAVKYTDKGGIKITLEQGAVLTRINIEDTGIGIAAEEYAKIFTRFYRIRGENRIEGTGLGLTISREIMRKQRGNITVESQCGKGSVFSVFLQN